MVEGLGVAHEYQTVGGDYAQDWENLSHRRLVKGLGEYEEHEKNKEEEVDE